MFREGLLSTLYTKKLVLLKIASGIFLFVFLIGILIHTIEPEGYPNIFEGVWWAIVTISTVGYGDFVPKSVVGRLLGIVLILVGIAVFSLFITNLAASTVVLKEQQEKGLGTIKKNRHLVVIGWNERSRLLIKQTHHLYPLKKIVLVDETLQKLSGQDYSYVRFIKGSPKSDETLIRANLQEAETVVISANLHIDETMADANTILTLITVRGLSSNVYTIVEMVTNNQLKNAKRVGADEVIEASYHVSLLLMNSALYHGLTDVISQMLEHEQKDHLSIHAISAEFIGKTFGDIIQQENTTEQFLLGLRREGHVQLHPSNHFYLQPGDELIYVRR
ncbi:potassium channel family protein [Salipaludibacillus sp. HK11]|uniref:potassium channel family protein n=1 Tax=Salipaludibacillus sp. HK11 TaxID=3394320 RepID=UPI0039FBCC2D